MSHVVSGLIGQRAVLGAARPLSSQAQVAPLEAGFGIMIGPEMPLLPCHAVPDDLAGYAETLSHETPVAFVATDYFGGAGEQGAMVWTSGEVASPYSVARIGPINDALRLLGFVVPSDALDAFEAIGLGWFRSREDWASYARIGHAGRPWETATRAWEQGRPYALWRSAMAERK